MMHRCCVHRQTIHRIDMIQGDDNSNGGPPPPAAAVYTVSYQRVRISDPPTSSSGSENAHSPTLCSKDSSSNKLINFGREEQQHSHLPLWPRCNGIEGNVQFRNNRQPRHMTINQPSNPFSNTLDWISLIDFSALRKTEGKVAVIDNSLESPAAYQPTWTLLEREDDTPTTDSTEETNIDLDTIPLNDDSFEAEQ